MCSRPFETRSRLSRRYPRGFAFYVAFPKSSVRPLGFAHLCRSRPRGSVHTLLPSSLRPVRLGPFHVSHPIPSVQATGTTVAASTGGVSALSVISLRRNGISTTSTIPTARLPAPSSAKSFAYPALVATAVVPIGSGIIPEKSPAKSDARPVTGIQLPITTGCARSPPQSLGKDAQAEFQETPRKPRKRLRLTRSREKMDSALAGGFASHPGNAGCDGAIHESSVDAADVERTSRCDVLESAKGSAPLPLDLFAADS